MTQGHITGKLQKHKNKKKILQIATGNKKTLEVRARCTEHNHRSWKTKE